MNKWPKANEEVAFQSTRMHEEKVGKFKELDEIGGVYFGVVIDKDENKHWVRKEHIKR